MPDPVPTVGLTTHPLIPLACRLGFLVSAEAQRQAEAVLAIPGRAAQDPVVAVKRLVDQRLINEQQGAALLQAATQLLHLETLAQTIAAEPRVERSPGLDLTRVADLPASTAVDLMAQTQGVGRYKLRDRLGQGGMGVVYRAFDPTAHRDVALKVMLQPQPSPKAVTRFLNEARITAQLEHPSIVPVHEVGTDARGLPFFVMKIVAGCSLKALLAESLVAFQQRRRDPFPLGERLNVFRKLADAVAFAHSRGVVHRDLKPDNVMVGEFGEVQVMDWGLAKWIGDACHVHSIHSNAKSDTPAKPSQSAGLSSSGRRGKNQSDRALVVTVGDPNLTQDGQIVGTFGYMAPEQARGDNHAVDERSDVYSLGAVLYELLTYSAPFRHATPYQLMMNIAHGRFDPPHKRIQQEFRAQAFAVPRELEAIVLKAMATNPSRRYASVREMVADIEAYLANLPITACRDSWFSWMMKWAKRRPTTAVVLALSVVAVLAGVSLSALWNASLTAADLARRDAELRGSIHLSKAIAAEQSAREAEIRRLLAEGRLDQLKQILGHVTQERDAVVKEFERLWNARPVGQEDREFFSQFSPDKIDAYLAAFDRVIQTHAATPDTASSQHLDYFYRGLLIQMAKGDHRRAIPEYDAALKLEPSHASSYNNRGLARAELNDFNGAITDYTAAIRWSPHNYPAYLNRGLAYHRLKRYSEAINDLSEAIRYNPRSPTPYFLRGISRRLNKDFPGGASDFTEALTRDPTYPMAHFQRGICRRNLGEWDQALQDLNTSITRNPTHADSYFQRGQCKRSMGDNPGAHTDFSTALKLDPHHADALFHRGRLRLDMDDDAGALADYNAFLTLEPDNPSGWVNRGLVYYRLKDYRHSIEDSTTALKLDAESASAYFNRGLAYVGLEQYATALPDFVHALKFNESHPDAPYFVGLCKLRTGDTAGALSHFDEAIRRTPRSWRAWGQRGVVLAQLGQKDLARESFDKAAACPMSTSAQASLAQWRRQALGE